MASTNHNLLLSGLQIVYGVAKIVVNRRGVPEYDVNALRANIVRLELDIAKFKNIIGKSKAQNRLEQVKTFTDAIARAEMEKAELAEYVRLIEVASGGN